MAPFDKSHTSSYSTISKMWFFYSI